MNLGNSSSLWMGDLEPHMDEDYLKNLYEGMGYRVHSVRMIRDRMTGKTAGYCFLEFESEQVANTVLMTLNLKQWPGTDKLLKLNWASTNNRGREEHSVYVGELSPEVDDNQLFKFFAAALQSCRSAKVVTDNNGASKGFGFVRFSNEVDARMAISDFNLSPGLGSRRIRVCKAFPKQNDRSRDQQQQQQQQPQSGYGAAVGSTYGAGTTTDQWQQYQQQMNVYNQGVAQYNQQYTEATDVVSYEGHTTAEQYNKEYLDYETEFADIMDCNRFQFIDSVTATKPAAAETAY